MAPVDCVESHLPARREGATVNASTTSAMGGSRYSGHLLLTLNMSDLLATTGRVRCRQANWAYRGFASEFTCAATKVRYIGKCSRRRSNVTMLNRDPIRLKGKYFLDEIFRVHLILNPSVILTHSLFFEDQECCVIERRITMIGQTPNIFFIHWKL